MVKEKELNIRRIEVLTYKCGWKNICRDTGEIIKSGNELVIDWIWKLCNMAFASSTVPED